MASQNEDTMVEKADYDSGDAYFYEDSHVWFSDGNIIIFAGPGALVPGREHVVHGDVYGFRCHKSVLANCSPVFEQMFEIPVNDQNNQFCDGVPVASISDDWEDVRDLLRILYGFQ